MTAGGIHAGGIHVNGVWQEADAGSALPTVAGLLAGHGIMAGTRGVAVAVNGAVVPARRWAETALNAGDSVEIVRPLQGG